MFAPMSNTVVPLPTRSIAILTWPPVVPDRNGPQHDGALLIHTHQASGPQAAYAGTAKTGGAATRAQRQERSKWMFASRCTRKQPGTPAAATAVASGRWPTSAGPE